MNFFHYFHFWFFVFGLFVNQLNYSSFLNLNLNIYFKIKLQFNLISTDFLKYWMNFSFEVIVSRLHIFKLHISVNRTSELPINTDRIQKFCGFWQIIKFEFQLLWFIIFIFFWLYFKEMVSVSLSFVVFHFATIKFKNILISILRICLL